MESVTKYAAHSSKLRVFPGSSSYKDPDIVELSSASASAWASSHHKRKRDQVVPHEVIEIDEDDDPDALVIIGESNLNHKDKQPVRYNNNWQKQIKNALLSDFNGSSTYCGSGKSPLLDIPRSPHSDSLNFDYPDLLNFGYPDGYPYDIYDYKDLIDNDYNYNLAAKFDDFGLPPRVEAMHCLQKSALETTIEKGQKTMVEDEIVAPIEKRQKTMIEDEIDVKFKSFKRFDTVQDHSDHYFTTSERVRGTHGVSKSSKNWSKKIQNDWKVLEKDLPETIFVRVYEDRMDLLRAVIIGPAGTPYHDGLFFFDFYFPPNYPQSPPHVHYHSGGLRLNPNLYACGKVCLSLLNTWSGHGCEKWNPSKSTMLQVLVSIQALVLNAKPYFNEPGFEKYANTPSGEDQSLAYNEQTFLLSCRTMLYSLRRPPKHFEDFVGGHFRNRGRAILVACRAYMDGAQVGCLVGEGVQDVDEGDKSCSSTFKSSLKQLYEDLVKELTAKGADCSQLVAYKAVMAGASRVLDTTLKL